MLLADRGYDADWIRAFVAETSAWTNIPSCCDRSDPICFSPHLYRARNPVARFANKIRQWLRLIKLPASRLMSAQPPTAAEKRTSPRSQKGHILT